MAVKIATKATSEETKKVVKSPAKASKPKQAEKEEIREKLIEDLTPIGDSEESKPERANTNPDAFMYDVKVDRQKYTGRNADQVIDLVCGTIGACKKVVIERIEIQ